MKRISAFILALVLISTASVIGVSASNTVLKGTPVIDGILDDIYTQSAEVVLGEAFFSMNGDLTTDVTAKAYLLYDDDFFYVCVTVNDGDILAADEGYVLNDPNPWINDMVEIWVDEGMTGNKYKVSLDAFNVRLFTDINLSFPNFGNAKGIATKNATTYVTEFALPLAGASSEGTVYGFALQVNDIDADNNPVALTSEDASDMGTAQAPAPYVFGGAVVLPEAPAADNPVAPKTFDASALFALIMLSAAAAFVMVRKTVKK